MLKMKNWREILGLVTMESLITNRWSKGIIRQMDTNHTHVWCVVEEAIEVNDVSDFTFEQQDDRYGETLSTSHRRGAVVRSKTLNLYTFFVAVRLK